LGGSAAAAIDSKLGPELLQRPCDGGKLETDDVPAWPDRHRAEENVCLEDGRRPAIDRREPPRMPHVIEDDKAGFSRHDLDVDHGVLIAGDANGSTLQRNLLRDRYGRRGHGGPPVEQNGAARIDWRPLAVAHDAIEVGELPVAHEERAWKRLCVLVNVAVRRARHKAQVGGLHSAVDALDRYRRDDVA